MCSFLRHLALLAPDCFAGHNHLRSTLTVTEKLPPKKIYAFLTNYLPEATFDSLPTPLDLIRALCKTKIALFANSITSGLESDQTPRYIFTSQEEPPNSFRVYKLRHASVRYIQQFSGDGYTLFAKERIAKHNKQNNLYLLGNALQRTLGHSDFDPGTAYYIAWNLTHYRPGFFVRFTALTDPGSEETAGLLGIDPTAEWGAALALA